MKNSIERIDPDNISEDEILGRETLALHLERYHFAGQNLVTGSVADIACGVGYGSNLLIRDYADRIENITAIDLDDEAITIAQSRYINPKVTFIACNALQFYSPCLFQNIISLETLEHLPDPAAFVKHLAAQLAHGGHFIASVPVTPSMDANPFHLHDFSLTSFKKMFLDAGFKELASMKQIQPYKLSHIFLRKDKRVEHIRKNILLYYFKHPDKFFLRLRSLLTDGLSNKYQVTVFEKL